MLGGPTDGLDSLKKRKSLPCTGIQTRTVQPVASHYMDYAIMAQGKFYVKIMNFMDFKELS
jgi:hypothetical protein